MHGDVFLRTARISLVALFAACAALAQQAVPIEPNKAIKRTAAPGEVHSYRLDLEKDQFVHFTVLQPKVLAEGRIRRGEDETLAVLHPPEGNVPLETFGYLAPAAGTYFFELQSPFPKLSSDYELTLDVSRPATAHDRLRFQAQQGFEAALGEHQDRSSNNLKAAVEKATVARGLFEKAGDEAGVLAASVLLAQANRMAGSFPGVIAECERALPLARKLGRKPAEAHLLNARGVALVRTGKAQAGLRSMRESRDVWRETGSPVGLAYLLIQQHAMYSEVGESTAAFDAIQTAVPLARSTGIDWLLNGGLISFGTALNERGRHKEALEALAEALPYYEKTQSADYRADILSQMSVAHWNLGDKAKGSELLDQAVGFARASGSPSKLSSVLVDLGDHQRNAGNLGKAIELFEEALAIRRGNPNPMGELSLVTRIGGVEYARKNLAAARSRASEAMRLVDLLQSGIGSPGLRAANLSSLAGNHNFYMAVQFASHQEDPKGGYAEKAFEMSERLHAQGLIETLREAKVDLRQGADPGLLEKERKLLEALAAKVADQRKTLARKLSETEAKASADALNDLYRQLDEVKGLIRLASPRYAAIANPTPLSLATIQHEYLDDGTILIEFYLGDRFGHVWVVSKGQVAFGQFPGRRVLEPLTREVYGYLNARNEAAKFPSRAAFLEHIENADAKYVESARKLSDMILGPVKEHLAAKRWIVVMDGPLQMLPMVALPVPGDTGERWKPILAGHEVVHLPSMSVLAEIRQQAAARRPAPSLLAVVADPVFDSTDPRLTSKPAKPIAFSEELTRRAIDDAGFADGKIPRLPFTRREAEAIFGAVPSGSKQKLLDFRAARDPLLAGQFAGYRMLHFATHGLLNSEHPDLSGLIFSLVDERGNSRDGFLRLADIYGLKLPADLVVLSACQTALGKDLRGQGLVGLTRGMVYAGASRVVASLWKVDDASTAELMKNFYASMSGGKLTPAAALREAQLALSGQNRWRAPYYWSAFVLQGEYR